LPTPTPKPVQGDVDADLEPDAAFVTSSGSATVVLNLSRTPVAVPLGRSVVAAGIGIAPGEQPPRPSLITASRAGKNYRWNSTNIVTGATRTFRTVPAVGVPIVNCYTSNAFTAAAHVTGKPSGTLRLYSSRDVLITLPVDVTQVRCSDPSAGTSTVLSLVHSAARKTMNVVGKNGASMVINSSRIDPKLSDVALSPLPRAPGAPPTVAILARMGVNRVVYVLDRTNRWQALPLPAVPKGDPRRPPDYRQRKALALCGGYRAERLAVIRGTCVSHDFPTF
jgi:hypothetical protein